VQKFEVMFSKKKPGSNLNVCLALLETFMALALNFISFSEYFFIVLSSGFVFLNYKVVQI